MRAREPTSFWRENLVAIVSLLRVLARKSVVAKTSYQMLEVLSFSGRERALSLSMEISDLTFVVKKSTMKLRRVSVLRG